MDDRPDILSYATPAPRRKWRWLIPDSFCFAVVQLPWWILVAVATHVSGPRKLLRDTLLFLIVLVPSFGAIISSVREFRRDRGNRRPLWIVALSTIALFAGIGFSILVRCLERSGI